MSSSGYYMRSGFNKTTSEYTRDRSVVGTIIKRVRVNQPAGFLAVHRDVRFINHYAEEHNYVYYPVDWEYQGASYKQGYYDENGNYYKKVIFAKNDSYYGLECECPYCGSVIERNWHIGEALKCENCGGNMEVKDRIDVYTQDPEYTSYNEQTQAESAEAVSRITKPIIIVIIVMFFLPFLSILGLGLLSFIATLFS